MVLTNSTMLSLGTKAPDFSLLDVVSNKTFHLNQVRDKKGLLIMFICCHCPYVIHVQHELSLLGVDYLERGIEVIAISSNDAEKYPDDAPDKLKLFAEKLDFHFPVLYDEDQSVAKKYTAACTPDFFLFDSNFELVYRGQLDDSRPGNQKPVDGADLREAVESLLANKEICSDQKPSAGCNIKWKPGNEPDYFGG